MRAISRVARVAGSNSALTRAGSSPERSPSCRLFATINATLGPGMETRTVVATTSIRMFSINVAERGTNTGVAGNQTTCRRDVRNSLRPEHYH